MSDRPPLPPDRDAAELLQDCLARVEAGASPTAVLADCDPDLAEAMTPLLLAAAAVRWQRAVPSAAFRRRAALALATAAPRRSGGLLWKGFGSRAGALRLAASAAAVLLALGGLTVAQASRNPQGWAGRVVAQAWDVARALPELWYSSTTAVLVPATPAARKVIIDTGLPTATARVAREAAGAGARSDLGSPATPGVQLGRKPRPSGAAAGSAAPTSTPTPSPAVIVAGPQARATVAAPAGTTPGAATGSPTRSAATTATALPAASPTAAASTGKASLASLSGRVTLGGGRPIPGIPVTLYRHDAAGVAHWWDAVAATRSDAEGRYQLRDLPPGSYKLMAGYRFLFAPRRWHPSAARSAEGQAVVLESGQTREAIDVDFGEEEAAPLLIWAFLGR